MTYSGNAADTTVEMAMSKDVTAFLPETDVGTLVNCFVIKQMRRVPIVEGGKVIGLVSRRDILREIQNHYSPSE